LDVLVSSAIYRSELALRVNELAYEIEGRAASRIDAGTTWGMGGKFEERMK
jgi:hypothetical protein